MSSDGMRDDTGFFEHSLSKLYVQEIEQLSQRVTELEAARETAFASWWERFGKKERERADSLARRKNELAEDVSVLSQRVRELEAERDKLRAERDRLRQRLVAMRDDARQEFGLGLMPWLLEDGEISATAQQLASIICGWHEAQSRAEAAESRLRALEEDVRISIKNDHASVR